MKAIKSCLLVLLLSVGVFGLSACGGSGHWVFMNGMDSQIMYIMTKDPLAQPTQDNPCGTITLVRTDNDKEFIIQGIRLEIVEDFKPGSTIERLSVTNSGLEVDVDSVKAYLSTLSDVNYYSVRFEVVGEPSESANDLSEFGWVIDIRYDLTVEFDYVDSSDETQTFTYTWELSKLKKGN